MHACDVYAMARYDDAYAQTQCQMEQNAGGAQAIDGELIAGDEPAVAGAL